MDIDTTIPSENILPKDILGNIIYNALYGTFGEYLDDALKDLQGNDDIFSISEEASKNPYRVQAYIMYLIKKIKEYYGGDYEESESHTEIIPLSEEELKRDKFIFGLNDKLQRLGNIRKLSNIPYSNIALSIIYSKIDLPFNVRSQLQWLFDHYYHGQQLRKAMIESVVENEHLGTIGDPLTYPIEEVHKFLVNAKYLNDDDLSLYVKNNNYITQYNASSFIEALYKKKRLATVYIFPQYHNYQDNYKFHLFKSKIDNISDLVNEMVSHITVSTQIVNVFTNKMKDPVGAIGLGLIPHPDLYSATPRKLVKLFREGLSVEEVSFWAAKNFENNIDPISILKDIKIWSYYTEEYALKSIHLGDPYLLIDHFPEHLYKSMRPITNMALFKTPRSRTNIEGIENYNFIPVARYAQGMSQGVYFDEQTDGGIYCGTFYYLEEDSKTFLAFNTSLMSFCKTTAVLELMLKLNPKHDEDSEENMINGKFFDEATKLLSSTLNQNLTKYITGVFPEDFRFTPNEFFEAFSDVLDKTNYSIGRVEIPESRIKSYNAYKANVYAQEDELDQILCKIGRRLNIDVIILTNMHGSRQIVTEVLDTRQREISINHLVFAK